MRFATAFALLQLFARFGIAQWQSLSLGPGTADYTVRDLHFVNDSVGFAACYTNMDGPGAVFKTADGGATWVPTVVASGLQAIAFTTTDSGYAVGSGGAVYRTVDQGVSWQLFNTLSPWYDLRSIYFKPNGESFIGSGIDLYSGDVCPSAFLHSTDGWQTFGYVTDYDSPVVVNPLNQVYDFYFLNNDTGIAVSDDDLYRTVNGGLSWHANQVIGDFQLTTFSSLFENPFNHTLYVCGRGNVATTNQFGVFHYSSDAGQTWTEYPADPLWLGIDTLGWIYDGRFVSPTVGYMVGGKWYGPNGGQGGIIRTVDGGQTWQDDYVGVNNASLFFTLDCPTPHTCYCGGYFGRLMKLENADLGTALSTTHEVASPTIDVFPSLVTTLCYVSIGNSKSEALRVYNGLGMVVMQTKTVNGNATLDFSKLNSGVYLLQTNGVTRRVVKL